MRASANVRARYFPAGVAVVLATGEKDEVYLKMWCSSLTHVTRVMQKAR